MDGLGELLLVAACGFVLLSAIGVVRFSDVFIRMHALTKASTMGLVLALIGAAFAMEDVNAVTSLVLAAVLHLVTSPIGSNLLARTTYHAEGIPTGIDTIDELAADGALAGEDDG